MKKLKKKPVKSITVRLTEPCKRKLMKLCYHYDLSQSYVISRLIDQYTAKGGIIEGL